MPQGVHLVENKVLNLFESVSRTVGEEEFLLIVFEKMFDFLFGIWERRFEINCVWCG